MNNKSEAWYIHAVLYVIIAILVYVLVEVAIVGPAQVVKMEKYYKSESRLRMENIREAEMLWEKKRGHYTDNLDSLIYFIQNDSSIAALVSGIDSMTGKSSNPFSELSNGSFIAESLFVSPKSHSRFSLMIDSSVQVDTFINRFGRIIRVDTTKEFGTLYLLECPDGYGKIGDLNNKALKNTASWE